MFCNNKVMDDLFLWIFVCCFALVALGLLLFILFVVFPARCRFWNRVLDVLEDKIDKKNDKN